MNKKNIKIACERKTIKQFNHSFDRRYLEFLGDYLELKNLIQCAQPYGDYVYVKNRLKGNESKVYFDKIINIDFCGFAASTLLETDKETLKTQSRGGAECYSERSRIRSLFLQLLNKDTLDKLNNGKLDPNGNKICVKIRFGFSYLYSDFPVFLAKCAALGLSNEYEVGAYDFSISKPLDESDLQNSVLWKAQMESLSSIQNILNNRSDLIFGSEEKGPNTIQVRFPLIPITLCTLRINDICFCDSYLYAKLEKQKPLSLFYPINVIWKATQDSKQFNSVIENFEYIFSHDLTLFCKDATKFDSKLHQNLTGLNEIKPPYKQDGKINIDWKHKEERFLERLKRDETDNCNLVSVDKTDIKNWRNNLNRKFERCTSKINLTVGRGNQKNKIISQVEKEKINFGNNLELKKKFFEFKNSEGSFCIIGYIRTKIYIKLKIDNDLEVFTFTKSSLPEPLCYLLHYAHAKSIGVAPIIHNLHLFRRPSLTQNISGRHNNTSKGVYRRLIINKIYNDNPKFSKELLKKLFEGYQLNIDPSRIWIDGTLLSNDTLTYQIWNMNLEAPGLEFADGNKYRLHYMELDITKKIVMH